MIKDVHEYMISMQKQMNEMNTMLEKVNKELEAGHCTWEQRENFQTYYNNVKANYDRLMYIEHLLKKPPKFIQKIQQKKLAKEQEAFLKKMAELHADEESVIAENEENMHRCRLYLSKQRRKMRYRRLYILR